MTDEPATAPRAGAPGSWLLDVLGGALAVAFLMLVTHHLAPEAGARALDPLGYGLLALAGGWSATPTPGTPGSPCSWRPTVA